MAKKKLEGYIPEVTLPTPAYDPNNRESQLINAAYEVAEKRIREGSASDTLIIQFLKMGSQRERLERVILEKEAELKAAKTESIRTAERIETLYKDAIRAFTCYRIDDDEDGEIIQ